MISALGRNREKLALVTIDMALYIFLNVDLCWVVNFNIQSDKQQDELEPKTNFTELKTVQRLAWHQYASLFCLYTDFGACVEQVFMSFYLKISTAGLCA